ncbi:MAG: PLP-dependent aspartate aminotransferase family protein [Bacteroidota bacterium]
MRNRQLHIQTRAVHAGEQPDPSTGASSPNIVMSSTFVAGTDASFSIEGNDADAPFLYSRWANPTVAQLEQKLADLEGAEACVAFASGMGAIAGLMLHCLKAGDHLVMSDVAYAGASELTNDLIPRLGISVTKVDMSDLSNVEAALQPNTRLVYIESPCNPIMRLTDIASVAALCKASGAELAVDSTFASPIATQPIALGADYVIHSLTKYIGGHGDALGGAVLGASKTLARLRQEITIHAGGIISPFNAWLIMRGVATLPIRMKAHETAALSVARFLEGHQAVTQVMYPGLPSHPQHALAKKQMRNFSGMLSFQTRDGLAVARVLAERLKIIHYAVSLGHHRSLVFYLPSESMFETSFRLSKPQEVAYKKYAGEGIFRLSVGIEDADDLCADLDQALSHLG